MTDSQTVSDGVWVAYSYDVGPYLISAHPTELEASRVVTSQGYGYVMFLPWGKSLDDAEAIWCGQ